MIFIYLHALWQYGFKQYEEVPVWHTIPYCPAFWTVFDITSSTDLISILPHLPRKIQLELGSGSQLG